MNKLVCLLVCGISVASATSTSSYFDRASSALKLVKTDIPAMKPTADDAAKRLAAGGKLWAAGQPSFISEMCGRAGGLMLIAGLGDTVPAASDVVLFANDGKIQLPDPVLASGALIVGIGMTKAPDKVVTLSNHAEEAGISPTLANLIPGWVFIGELTAALTRLGKMPVFYETIGLPGGYPRIDEYQKKGILWHEKHSVPQVAPGVLGGRYVDAVSALLKRVDHDERDALDKAVTWIAQAKQKQNRVIFYCMGHFIPDELANSPIGKRYETAVWNSGFASESTPKDTYRDGDVLLHIGYQHPPYGLFEKARPAGARVVYVDVLRHRDYVNDTGVIWIDPMWVWADACVSLEGYDIPILPPSAIVNATIAWELCEKSTSLL